MRTGSDAVLRFHRQAEIAWHVACAAVAAMIGLVIYVGWLTIQLHNCYA